MFKQVYMGGFEVLNKIEKGLPTENTKHKMEEHQNKISDKADFNYLAVALNTSITRLYYQVFKEDESNQPANEQKNKLQHSEYIDKIKEALNYQNCKINHKKAKTTEIRLEKIETLKQFLFLKRLSEINNELKNSEPVDTETLDKLQKTITEIKDDKEGKYISDYINVIDFLRLELAHHALGHESSSETSFNNLSKTNLEKIDKKSWDFFNQLLGLSINIKQAKSLKLSLSKENLTGKAETIKRSTIFFLSFSTSRSEIERILDCCKGLKNFRTTDEPNNFRFALSYFAKRDKRKDFYAEEPDLETLLKSYSYLYSFPETYQKIFTPAVKEAITKKYQETLAKQDTHDTNENEALNHLWRKNQETAFSIFHYFWLEHISKKNLHRISFPAEEPTQDQTAKIFQILAGHSCELDFAITKIPFKNENNTEENPQEPNVKNMFLYKNSFDEESKDKNYPFNNNSSKNEEEQAKNFLHKTAYDGAKHRNEANKIYISDNCVYYRLSIFKNDANSPSTAIFTVNYRISKKDFIYFISQLINHKSSNLGINSNAIKNFIEHSLAMAFDDEYFQNALFKTEKTLPSKISTKISKQQNRHEMLKDALEARIIESEKIQERVTKCQETRKNLSKRDIDYILEVINSYLDLNSDPLLERLQANEITIKEQNEHRKITTRQDFDEIREALINFRSKSFQEIFFSKLQKINPELNSQLSKHEKLDTLILALVNAEKGIYTSFLKNLITNLETFNPSSLEYLASKRFKLNLNSIYIDCTNNTDLSSYISSIRKAQFPRETNPKTGENYELKKHKNYEYFKKTQEIYRTLTRKGIHETTSLEPYLHDNEIQTCHLSGCVSISSGISSYITEDQNKKSFTTDPNINKKKVTKEERENHVKESLVEDLKATYPLLADQEIELISAEFNLNKESKIIKQELYLDKFISAFINFSAQNGKFSTLYPPDKNNLEATLSIKKNETIKNSFLLNSLKPEITFSENGSSRMISLDSLATLLTLLRQEKLENLIYVLFDLAPENRKGSKQESSVIIDFNVIHEKFKEHRKQLSEGIKKILEIEEQIYIIANRHLKWTYLNKKGEEKDSTGFNPYRTWFEDTKKSNLSDKQIASMNLEDISRYRNACFHDGIAGYIAAKLEWGVATKKNKKFSLLKAKEGINEIKNYLGLKLSKETSTKS